VGDAASYPRYIATPGAPYTYTCASTYYNAMHADREFSSRVSREKRDAIATATRKLDQAETSTSGPSTRGVFRSTSLAPSKTAGNGYYGGDRWW